MLAAQMAAVLLAVVPAPEGDADARIAAGLTACAPSDYQAALDCLDKHLPADVQVELAKPKGTIMAHVGLGMWIRNNWGLWQQGRLYRSMEKAYGLAHPDDMSGAILEGFAARERGEPYDVAAEAAKKQAEFKVAWDKAVNEGRAGSFDCPDDGKPMSKAPTEAEVSAALERCVDAIEKQLERQTGSEPK